MDSVTTRLLAEYAQKYETANFLRGDPSWFMHQVEGLQRACPLCVTVDGERRGRQSSTIQVDCQPLSRRRAEDGGSHERHFAEPT